MGMQDAQEARIIAAINAAGGGGGSGGDASAAKQDTGNASLASIDSKTPAAPATAGNQATQITAEQAILAKIIVAPATQALQPAVTPSQNSGVTDAGTQRVVLASDGPTVTALGTTTQTKATDGTTTAWSIIQLLKGIFDKLLGSLAVTIATAPVLVAGSAVIGKTGIDQTTPGTTNLVALTPETTKVIGTVNLTDISAAEYETVAASQTAQALGATGATGDYISGVLVVPATLNPGNVLLLDNATSITIFTGGTASVSNLVPFFIPLGMKSVSGAWKLTTGANVSCIGIGNFT